MKRVRYAARDILEMDSCADSTAVGCMAHRWYIETEDETEFLLAPRFSRVPAIRIPVPVSSLHYEVWVTYRNPHGWFGHVQVTHPGRQHPVTVSDPVFVGRPGDEGMSVERGRPRVAEVYVLSVEAGTEYIEISKNEEMESALVAVEFRPVDVLPDCVTGDVAGRAVVLGIIDMGVLSGQSLQAHDQEVLRGCYAQMAAMGFSHFFYQIYGGSAKWTDVAKPIRTPAEGHRSHGNWVYPNHFWCDTPEKVQADIDSVCVSGMKVVASFRINNEWLADWSKTYATHPDGNPDFASKFSVDHPEWRNTYRSGQPAGGGMDFAYQEVRQHRLDVIREWCDKFDGFDGVCIDLYRHPPMVAYAEHVVQAFKEKTGVDVRMVEPLDEELKMPEWFEFRAKYFTEFMRMVRNELRERYGDRVLLSARVGNSFERAMLDGSDLRVWIDEGLIDMLVLQHRAPANPPEMDIRPIIEAAKPRGIKVVPLFGGWDAVDFVASDLAPIRSRLGDWLGWSADGFGFYEGGRIAVDGRWIREMPTIVNGWGEKRAPISGA